MGSKGFEEEEILTIHSNDEITTSEDLACTFSSLAKKSNDYLVVSNHALIFVAPKV